MFCKKIEKLFEFKSRGQSASFWRGVNFNLFTLLCLYVKDKQKQRKILSSRSDDKEEGEKGRFSDEIIAYRDIYTGGK